MNPFFFPPMSNTLPTYKNLEIVENVHQNKTYTVKISIPEFNCVCTKTGLPDFGIINIEYVPNKYID